MGCECVWGGLLGVCAVWAVCAAVCAVCVCVCAVFLFQPALHTPPHPLLDTATHSDIKPENVLLTDDLQLKVADFGLAIALNEERAVTRVGE